MDLPSSTSEPPYSYAMIMKNVDFVEGLCCFRGALGVCKILASTQHKNMTLSLNPSKTLGFLHLRNTNVHGDSSTWTKENELFKA